MTIPPRVDQKEVIKGKIVYRNPHRFADCGGLVELDFKAVAFALMQKKQVKFGTGVGRPEKSFFGIETLDNTGVSEINPAPRPEASIGGPFGKPHA